jgi:hypothetical protein
MELEEKIKRTKEKIKTHEQAQQEKHQQNMNVKLPEIM